MLFGIWNMEKINRMKQLITVYGTCATKTICQPADTIYICQFDPMEYKTKCYSFVYRSLVAGSIDFILIIHV